MIDVHLAWMGFVLLLVFVVTCRPRVRLPLRRRRGMASRRYVDSLVDPLEDRLTALEAHIPVSGGIRGPVRHFGEDVGACKRCPAYLDGDWCIVRNKTYDATTNPRAVPVCGKCWPENMPER